MIPKKFDYYTMHDISQYNFYDEIDDDPAENLASENLYSVSETSQFVAKIEYPKPEALQNARQSLPESLKNAAEELIEKYVTILHFVIRGREIRINEFQAKIDDEKTSQSQREKLQAKINMLHDFTNEARIIKSYKYSNEQDELLTQLLDMDLTRRLISD